MVKNPPTNVGDIRDASLTSGWGGAPGRGHSNPLQYAYLESLMDRGAWWAIQSMGSQRVRHNGNDLARSGNPKVADITTNS